MEKLSIVEVAELQDYFYLSFEDFRPVMVCNNPRLRYNYIALGNLKEVGALFPTKEDATYASNAIKAFLAGNQLSLQSRQQPRSQRHESLEESSPAARTLLEETLNDENKRTQSNTGGQTHSGTHSPQTVLIKIFHP